MADPSEVVVGQQVSASVPGNVIEIIGIDGGWACIKWLDSLSLGRNGPGVACWVPIEYLSTG